MMNPAGSEAREWSSQEEDFLESLHQAFARSPRGLANAGEFAPQALTVAVSREAGSRGGTIARRAAQLLGWQLYNQELLEYLAHEKHLGGDLFRMLDRSASEWIEARLEELIRTQRISQNQAILELARVVLAIGVRGEAVVLGRGAGCIMPAETTLHVRIVAPIAERIAYMSQFERMTSEQAAAQVEQRDQQRALFVETHFFRRPADVYQYAMVLNSAALGEELSAQLIVTAAKARDAARRRRHAPPHLAVPENLS